MLDHLVGFPNHGYFFASTKIPPGLPLQREELCRLSTFNNVPLAI